MKPITHHALLLTGLLLAAGGSVVASCSSNVGNGAADRPVALKPGETCPAGMVQTVENTCIKSNLKCEAGQVVDAKLKSCVAAPVTATPTEPNPTAPVVAVEIPLTNEQASMVHALGPDAVIQMDGKPLGQSVGGTVASGVRGGVRGASGGGQPVPGGVRGGVRGTAARRGELARPLRQTNDEQPTTSAAGEGVDGGTPAGPVDPCAAAFTQPSDRAAEAAPTRRGELARPSPDEPRETSHEKRQAQDAPVDPQKLGFRACVPLPADAQEGKHVFSVVLAPKGQPNAPLLEVSTAVPLNAKGEVTETSLAEKDVTLPTSNKAGLPNIVQQFAKEKMPQLGLDPTQDLATLADDKISEILKTIQAPLEAASASLTQHINVTYNVNITIVVNAAALAKPNVTNFSCLIPGAERCETGMTVETSKIIFDFDCDRVADASAADPRSPTPAPCSFKCSKNKGEFFACEAPFVWTGLKDGVQTFSVKATDKAGVEGPEARKVFSVIASDADDRRPVVELIGPPAILSNSASATFTFNCDLVCRFFKCSLDGAKFASCTSPFAASKFSDGPHTFSVKALATNGEESSPTSYSWTIDTKAPDTILGRKPAALANIALAAFEFASTEPDSVFFCQLDVAAPGPCVPPVSFTMTEGAHTFSVYAQDKAGNKDATPTAVSWTVDTTVPETAVTSKPSLTTASTAATFIFNSPDAGAAFECDLDGAGFAACASPQTFSGLAAGAHTFSARAKDAAGNIDSTPTSYTWTIDTAPPKFGGLLSATAATTTSITLSWNAATDNLTASADILYDICQSTTPGTCQMSFSVTTTATSIGGSGFTATGLNGALSYYFVVRARDQVGNTDTNTTQQWVIPNCRSGSICTYAGGAGGTLPASKLGASVGGLALDGSGNMYVSDGTNHRIRKITPAGVSTVYAGNGFDGSTGDGGVATSAAISNIDFGGYVAVDTSGNVYFSDKYKVRKVSTAGLITTVAGTGTTGFSGDGGAATSAQVTEAQGISVDSAGNLYICDRNNHRIRKVNTSGIISTIAGNGTAGSAGDGAAATLANLNGPLGVRADSSGHVYISDRGNNKIRMVPASTGTFFGQAMTAGNIYTIAGNGTLGFAGDGGAATAANLNENRGISTDATGNLFIADYSNNRIRMVPAANGTYYGQAMTANNIYTIAGDGTSALSLPSDVAIDAAGKVYFVRVGVAVVHKLDSSGALSTYASDDVGSFGGDGGVAAGARLNTARSVAVDASGNIYLADQDNHRVRKIDSFGVISTLAGTGTAGFSGDGGAATAATLNAPRGVAVDSSGNVYISDTNNNRIRKVNAGGTISTVAGNGTAGLSGDGGPATSANLTQPLGLAVDSVGNVYFAANHRVRRIDTLGLITTVAGTTAGFSGDGGAATSAQLNDVWGVAMDSGGNLYLADRSNGRIRKVNTAGVISTFAGNGCSGFAGDGGAATSASLCRPLNVAVDSSGNLYIADELNQRIRKANTSNIMSTIAGTGAIDFGGDGAIATGSKLNYPEGIAVDSAGNVYIADKGNHRVRLIKP